jgi:hypothetical protein
MVREATSSDRHGHPRLNPRSADVKAIVDDANAQTAVLRNGDRDPEFDICAPRRSRVGDGQPGG